MPETKKKPDNSLLDIVVNVIAPVMILSYMSKEEGKFWHLGPVTAMAIALILPLAFGIWHFIKHKKLNLFSCVGLFAILLTGLITIYLFYNEASRPHVGIIFGIKEAVQPLVIGSLFLITHKMASPLLNTFLYNDALFDVKRIEKSVKAKESQPDYKALLWKASLIMFGSFCVSAVANLALSLYFFKGLSPHRKLESRIQRNRRQNHRLGIPRHRRPILPSHGIHPLLHAQWPQENHRPRNR